MPSGIVVAPGVVVPPSALRLGIVDPRLYDDLFFSNFKKWVTRHNACPLSVGMSDRCKGTPFNVIPAGKNPMIEWSDVVDSETHHALGEVGKGAVIETATLPYMKHPAMALRPTLLMFLVTGHVMAAIYFVTPSGGELHLLNPWPLGITQQLKDVYSLIEEKLGKGARKIRIVDVAAQVESYISSEVRQKVAIDLQSNEKIGFCTLWVGIISHRVIVTQPDTKEESMTFLQREVTSSPTAPGYQLSPKVLDFYWNVYGRLLTEKDMLMEKASKTFGDNCSEATAAIAVVQLAAKSGKGGKRTVGRRTHRKKSSWKRRNQRSSSTVRRIRRSARKRGNII